MPTDSSLQPNFEDLSAAVATFAKAGIEERGAIFTRQEVVEFILDLIGYTVDVPLYDKRLLEPSFGHGDFLIPAVRRLLNSYKKSGKRNLVIDLSSAIRAVELHDDSYDDTYKKVYKILVTSHVNPKSALKLCNTWLVRGDFLLTDFDNSFTHVIGNPPYVRQESIPQTLIDEYRKRYSTIYDRADLYVPFIEKSLHLLELNGVLGFICADRWIKNKYGGPLRKLISEQFHLRAYVDMVDTPAFISEVSAYPAIFVIGKERGKTTKLAYKPLIETSHLNKLANAITGKKLFAAVREVGLVADGNKPWLLESFDQLNIVRNLEERFPVIEEVGCKIGIGVATGADKAFIGQLEELDVEEDRKIPLVMTRDIISGKIKWRGFGVINPFADDGQLVELKNYPHLRKYLMVHKAQILGRHVAKKNIQSWYRTIDRIYPELVRKPKLLIPDIKGEAQIVYDSGSYYPHHNLYYITSNEWDIRALQAVLLSGIARLFVAAYSTKMRGGYLRFQAQYLRRIRLPHWHDVPKKLQKELIEAGRKNLRCASLVADLYGIVDDEGIIFSEVDKAA